MKNKKQTILIILISVLIILGITAFVLATTINKTKANTGTGEEDINAQQTISFNDENLYNAIKEQLHSKNIEYTANDTNKTLTMTQININKVNELSLINKGITDITGLEKFTKLQTLFLNNNQISDISALSGLTNLQRLYLWDNQISDISALSGLTNLQTLDLNKNNIEDITPINNISSLQYCTVYNQTINKTITSGKEIALPQILIDAKNSSSIAYVGNGIDYQLTNCTISSDGKKVIVNDGETTAKVTIGGTTGAYGTTLEIKAKSDTIDISFNDINLYNAIKKQLHSKNIEYTANDTNKTLTMTQININKVNELSLINKGITDITGLEKFTKLQTLFLNNNQISDISALSGLTNLQTLYLNDNQISDISALSGLTNLQELHLYKNQINKIDAISGLTNLQELHLYKNQINKIDAISGLTNLTYLSLDNNQIIDIGAISSLTNLQRLYLENNQISDISALSNLTNLQTLSLGKNHKISDISALLGLTNLQMLFLWDNQISDISALSNLTNLQTLYLHKNQINKIDAISGLTNLQTLSLWDNQISDISALSGLTNLQKLELDNNQISDISALSNLTNLQELYLYKNQINKIDAISGLTNLQTLSLWGNQISDIDAIKNLKKLEELYLRHNNIEDITPINSISSLKEYNVYNQTINKTITSGREIALPQILIDAKNSSSKAYVGNGIDYQLTNCTISSDGKKVIVNDEETTATVTIGGTTGAYGTTLNIEVKCDHTVGYEIKYNKTEHWKECTECGAELEGSRKNHIYGKILPNGNGTHTKKCTGCPYSKTENCTYINGKCSECGATKPNTGCVHNYITQYNETEHWEYCTKCRAEKPGSRQSHTYGVATSNGNGTHTKKCTVCSYSKTEYCSYVNGKCSECGGEKPDTECTHNYVPKHNETEHWEECTICRIELEGSRQNHIYGKETSNGNGTHTKKCTVCSYSKTENCNYVNGKCSECGATKPDNENPGDGQDNTNNGQNNGNNTGNNTNNGNSNNGNSGGKPLPQTGTSSVVIIGIIAFTVLGTLTFIRIKKYKLN